MWPCRVYSAPIEGGSRNGIYGWFGPLPEPQMAQHVLDGMLAVAVPVNPVAASDRVMSTFRSADLCAGVTSRAGSTLISQDGDIVVVLSEITPIGDAAASVPPNMQLKRTQLRWFFKRALADFLPRGIIGKRKQGFGLPVGLWMADYAPLRELTHESIRVLKRRGVVRPDYIDRVERKHAGEHASYYGVMLWVLVMLEQWMRTYRA